MLNVVMQEYFNSIILNLMYCTLCNEAKHLCSMRLRLLRLTSC